MLKEMTMQINPTSNNLNAMQQAQTQMGELAQDVNEATNPAKLSDPKTREVTPDLLKAITEQIPTQIAYEASGEAIKVQDAVQESLLDIKA